MIRLLLAALLLGALIACGTEQPPAASQLQPEPELGAAAIADPTAVTIPAIDAHSTLIPLGLDNGALAVPPVDQPMQASWYAGADPAGDGDEFQPGENGPAIIAGHVDGIIDGRKGQPGIFHRLHQLTPGSEILVDRADGSVARFLVERVQRYPKNAFPTDEVYGPTARPELRLITCGGAFDRSAGHYTDNVIAWAVLA